MVWIIGRSVSASSFFLRYATYTSTMFVSGSTLFRRQTCSPISARETWRPARRMKNSRSENSRCVSTSSCRSRSHDAAKRECVQSALPARRVCQIVVCACLECVDAIGDFGASGEHQRRRVYAFAPELTHDVDTTTARQPDVEQQEIWFI